MLKFLTTVRQQICDVYVVGGKGGLENIDEDKSMGGGDNVGEEAAMNRVEVFESVKMSKVETVNKSMSTRRSRKETTTRAGKLKSISTEDVVEKNAESSVKKSLFQSSKKSVVENMGDSVGNRKAAAKEVGKSVGEGVGGEDNDAEDLGYNVGTISESVGMRVRTEESVRDKTDYSLGVGLGDDSEDDGSYMPSSEDEETDDDVEAEDMVSEDEEYTQGRKKVKENKEKEFVVTDDIFYGTVSGGKKSEYV
ncbi:uncharacterized protein LOC121771843 [Salvia splendens]|uniref:uncharacterized protein LOC121771843 n=1 Tax=Salvia splendens TaxID=180675 RepID=UPI001C26B01D|nr:uncharacterized protein LOC121771843 [Salvia splendens]